MFLQQQAVNVVKLERKRMKALITQLRERCEILPKGSLVYKNGNYYRSICYKAKKEQIIISQGFPNRQELIRELQEGRFIKKALPVLEHNLAAYDRLLKQLQFYDPLKIRDALPAYYGDFDLEGLLLEEDIDPHSWANADYEKNTAFPEQLKCKSEGGLATRSKAEADIATKLEQSNLVFRYEPIIYLGEHCFSPDFCILHGRREKYWEHLGQMDNPDYANKNMDKLRVYVEHGYRLGDNLIVTWETKENPLNFQHINDRIHKYLS